MVACGDAERAKLATHVLKARPILVRPLRGRLAVGHLSAGYARPKGLAHPRLSMVGPLRGPMYAHRAGDHKGGPYTCG